MPITIDGEPLVSVGASRWLRVDMRPFLDDDDVLNGTPTMVQVGASNLTITNVAKNSAIVHIRGKPVPINKAVVGFITGIIAGGHTVLVTVADNSSEIEPFNVEFEGA